MCHSLFNFCLNVCHGFLTLCQPLVPLLPWLFNPFLFATAYQPFINTGTEGVSGMAFGEMKEDRNGIYSFECHLLKM